MTTTSISDSEKPSRARQKMIAWIVAMGTFAYLATVVSGIIKPANRLTGAEFGIVVIAALAIGAALRPEFFERLQKLDVAGIKVELGEVKRSQIEVEKTQQEQAAILQDVRLALRLLIGKNEQEHLINIFKHTTGNYRVKGPLRDELRHLRAMNLLRMRGNKSVGGMPDNTPFDLSDYVELTDDGRQFASRLVQQPELHMDASAP
jgi:hypothetical protein